MSVCPGAEEARILRAAADLLESEGWCPRLGGNVHEGPYCAVEATTEACDRGVAPWSFQTPALDVLRRHVGSPIFAEWNDAQPGPEPVIAALRAAADEAEAS